ncbi:MAG: hypothetical protein ACREIP_00325 [Alphaproteobacteria bacterium]
MSLRFWGAALMAVAWSQTVVGPAHAPNAVSPRTEIAADPGRPDPQPFIGFGVALREAYAEFTRTEGETLGADFDASPFARNLKTLAEHIWPEPLHAAALGLDGPTGIAADEARLRLLRLFALGARELHPRLAAGAQAGLECWATRAAARRDAAAQAVCKSRFFDAAVALEDALLPLRTTDQFSRRLAREYLAYAHYKSAVEGDRIDARHFADKGLRAAETQALEPEDLARWFGMERPEARDLAFWRIRLEFAIETHRAGPLAATAALALARYDCWVDRIAGRAAAAFASKCRGEFVDAMRRLENVSEPEAETVPIRFGYDRLNLATAEREKVERAARDALERNAIVAVAAVASARGHWNVEGRLAWRRAETVAGMLSALGVPDERIRLLQRPASPAENEAGARRVDIVMQVPPAE